MSNTATLHHAYGWFCLFPGGSPLRLKPSLGSPTTALHPHRPAREAPRIQAMIDFLSKTNAVIIHWTFIFHHDTYLKLSRWFWIHVLYLLDEETCIRTKQKLPSTSSSLTGHTTKGRLYTKHDNLTPRWARYDWRFLPTVGPDPHLWVLTISQAFWTPPKKKTSKELHSIATKMSHQKK